MTIWIGIDLGNKGGIAWIDDKQIAVGPNDYISIPEAIPMPELDKEKFSILEKIATTLRKNERAYQPCQLWMEDIQVYTNMNINVAAYQSLYQETGKFIAWGLVLNIPVFKVHARTWQAKMNCLPLQGQAKTTAMKGLTLEGAKDFEKEFGSKGLAYRECKKRFKGLNLIAPGGRVPHEGMIDAVLIAEYARQLSGK